MDHEEQSKQENTIPWPDEPSDEFPYAAAVQLSNKENNNQMITDEVPEPLLQLP